MQFPNNRQAICSSAAEKEKSFSDTLTMLFAKAVMTQQCMDTVTEQTTVTITGNLYNDELPIHPK